MPSASISEGIFEGIFCPCIIGAGILIPCMASSNDVIPLLKAPVALACCSAKLSNLLPNPSDIGAFSVAVGAHVVLIADNSA